MPPPLKRQYVLVLQAMHELNQENEYLWTFKRIAEATDISVLRSDIRRIVRFLKRRGYVSYSQAFDVDDYYVCGSGHAITAEGILYLQSLKEV